MDETQKRNLGTRALARAWLSEHKKIGFSVSIIFLSLFTIYIAFIVFYSSLNEMSAISQQENPSGQNTTESFFERLLPTFSESEEENKFDENGLPILKNSTTTLSNLTNNIGSQEEVGANLFEIEREPVLSYVVFDKPISIKQYIKNKPKNCLEKISVVLKKEEKSKAVLNFQNILKSVEGFEELEVTETLDEKTREQIYIFQKRYSEILYKSKTDKEPTRVIDKETAHFLNLLCAYDKEEPSDFVNIPTVRYAKKSTREIFDFNTISKEKIALNNKLATGSQEAVFSPTGDFVIFRSEGKPGGKQTGLGEIETEVVNLNNSNRNLLEKNISTLDISEKNLVVFGVGNDISMTIKTYDPTKQEVKRLAEIPMREWNVFWLDKDGKEIGIYNKPSAFAEGVFMVLNTATKKIERKISPQLGLSVKGTNFSEFSIASFGGVGTLQTVLINNKTKNLGALGLQTFAEKCSKNIIFEGVFCAVPNTIATNIVYPDDWYKGKYLSEDSLIYKSISGTTTKIISSFSERPKSIINLQVHKNGIFFLDEKTFSLFSVEV